ncbi:hypothetical protein [Rathayibacter sp. VKM Ac-2857]|uniref:hypothetical protein n=1 Tax=Rathayibacter sp. VKM Ac-2857 TaxID=2739020 RepID=UPI001565E0BC|nr:hypothetical protein [Rathayibacter sp. VKM Ac-2857]NQX18339.1 hypothetical protein [Rathayibacter sp. VKM Ac-2857]
MKRVDILYNGTPYTVLDSTTEQFQAEVDAVLAADMPQWVKVTMVRGARTVPSFW